MSGTVKERVSMVVKLLDHGYVVQKRGSCASCCHVRDVDNNVYCGLIGDDVYVSLTGTCDSYKYEHDCGD